MIQIVHLYAKEYGWTRDYILDHVYVDEHILQHEIIQDNQRNDWLMQATISLLPNYEEEDRKKFLESLQGEKKANRSSIKEGQKTDFEAIKRAKEQLKNK